MASRSRSIQIVRLVSDLVFSVKPIRKESSLFSLDLLNFILFNSHAFLKTYYYYGFIEVDYMVILYVFWKYGLNVIWLFYRGVKSGRSVGFRFGLVSYNFKF